jgi:hypothetical protein
MLIDKSFNFKHVVVTDVANENTPNAAFVIDETTKTADGVYLLRKYTLVYQIEEAGRFLPKKVRFVRTGNEVINDLSLVADNFAEVYEGPKDEFLLHLRGYVRNIVTVCSTIAIKGNHKSVIRDLRKSAFHVDEIMQDMKKTGWHTFYDACRGAYMFFHIRSNDEAHDTYTLTDVQSMSDDEIDRYLARVNRNSTSFRVHGEEEMRKRLRFGHILCQSSCKGFA